MLIKHYVSSHARDCALDGSFEVFELDRFDEMFREPCLQASLDITVVAEAANRDSGSLGDSAQLHHEIHAASVRQSNIADEQIELIARCRFHGRADIVSCCHKVPTADKQFLQSSARVLMIVNE